MLKKVGSSSLSFDVVDRWIHFCEKGNERPFSNRAKDRCLPEVCEETVSGTAVSSNCVLGWIVYAGPDSDQETAPTTVASCCNRAVWTEEGP